MIAEHHVPKKGNPHSRVTMQTESGQQMADIVSGKVFHFL